jgi:hypothetical protein
MSYQKSKTNKTNLMEALFLSQSLEKLPHGKIITAFKLKLNSDEFIQAINYVGQKTWETFIQVCPPEILDQMKKFLEEEKEDEYQEFLANVVLLNKDMAQALDNGLDFYGSSYARVKNINLSIE